MRFLLDTNILIPLEDSRSVLEPSLTNFVRLATQHSHNLLYHPASERDIARDTNRERQRQTLERIQRYERLQNPPVCPWNTPGTSDNDAADNEILYALERNAVHGLVTEDREIHKKARARGLSLPAEQEIEAFDYVRKFFPHYKAGEAIGKFVVPIKPAYHDILFPDYTVPQGSLFRGTESTVGNAIKLAYLCHAQQGNMEPGDLLLFYRSEDVKGITSLGVVERFCVSADQDEIASIVRRRTVYNMEEIRQMADRPTKVILFRLVGHFKKDIPSDWMRVNKVVKGNIQSIRSIGDQNFERVRQYAES